jgi:hypothetical protein
MIGESMIRRKREECPHAEKKTQKGWTRLPAGQTGPNYLARGMDQSIIN